MNPHAFVAYRQSVTLHEAAEASALRAVRVALGPNANLFSRDAERVAGELIAAKRAACLVHAAAWENMQSA